MTPKFSNVLLVEDDPITIMVCERIIKMSNFSGTVVSCENGKAGIDFLNKIIEGEKPFPDIIFLDINMPVMNGWDFLEEFQKITGAVHPLPRVFILSSTVDPEDYKKAEAFKSVESFISKPLSKDFLDNIN